jgi:hypothetical protein
MQYQFYENLILLINLFTTVAPLTRENYITHTGILLLFLSSDDVGYCPVETGEYIYVLRERRLIIMNKLLIKDFVLFHL